MLKEMLKNKEEKTKKNVERLEKKGYFPKEILLSSSDTLLFEMEM